ncbi:DUF4214 domain-containing protein [Prochlorococcus marinus]|uniref:DUF4214 domain-containing protein n=1 Tax=Prochlorococcus marinus TaxID=1219 RepID=UPI0022B432AB|nr:DUF4214 domain-containing protein [Prochlorococcus marinus]
MNVNDAPTNLAPSASSFNENISAGATVATLSSTDKDSSDSHTYSLVSGTGSTDNSAFTISGNSLKIAASPDYETKSDYAIRLQTSDDNGGTYQKALIFSVNNQNDAPTNLAASASSFNEHIAAGATVATLSSTDQDSGDSHTYSLVSGTGSTDNSAFTISGNSLKISASPDYETKSSYAIRLQTSDGNGGTYQKALIFSVNNLYAPTNISLNKTTFDENIVAGTAVVTLSSTDADAGDSHTYSLVSGTGDTDNSAFTISGNSLKIAASPDYETKTSYNIRLQTSDSTETFAKEFTLYVNDRIDTYAATDISLSATSFNENIAAGTAVATLSSTDIDPGESHTYTLLSGSGDTDNSAFTIDGTSLKIVASPDYETKTSYNIRVQTVDNNGFAFAKALTINVNDLVDTTVAATNISLSATSFNENIAAGTAVATLSSTDIDPGETHTYTLLSGSGDTDNSAFTIDGTSLKIVASPDYETKTSYNIRVQTVDNNGFAFAKALTINVNDLVDTTVAATNISLSATSFNENIAAGTAVATLSSTDADAGDTHTYSLVSGSGSTDNSAFTISGSSLKIAASPDHETKSSYNIRVKTIDSHDKSFEKALTLTTKNVNEAITGLTVVQTNFDENLAAGSAVATLIANDTDSSDTHTYSLVNGSGDTDNSAFTISDNKLKIVASPDYESKSSYQIRLQTSDGSSTFEKVVLVSVNDLNEITTTNSDDLLNNTTNADYINGKDGTDTVVYNNSYSHYDIINSKSGLKIKDNNVIDTLVNIEKVQFSDCTVDADKLGIQKRYHGAFKDFEFISKGDGTIQIKSQYGISDVTGYPELNFTDKTVSAINDIQGTFDQITGKYDSSGKTYRLYKAAFDRFPDKNGLAYWINESKSGKSDLSIADNFIKSEEFRQLYGINPTNETFVTKLYDNVLDRTPDQGGYDYWVGHLNAGINSKEQVLCSFSESPENMLNFDNQVTLI